MVEITILRDKDTIQFTLEGHADYDPGNDIVCSAISSLIWTLVGALDNTFTKHEAILNKGYSKVTIYEKDIESITIVRTVEIGLEQIQKKYPEHLEINYLSS